MNISVIIPSYGPEQHLEELVARLEAQTVRPAEIIIAHSGGGDPSGKLRNPDARVTVLHSDRRWYPGAARNAGAAAAQGDWLAFIDSDVLPDATWLEGFARAAEADEGKSFFAGSLGRAPNEGYWGTCMWFIVSGSVHPYRGPHEMLSAPGANLFVRRSAFEETGGFPAGMAIGEDALFCVRLRGAGYRLFFVPEARGTHPFGSAPLPALRRLAALGEGAARVRLAADLPGSRAARFPVFALPLFLVRHAQIALRVILEGGPVAGFLVHSPGILAGLLAWNIGFLRGAMSSRCRG